MGMKSRMGHVSVAVLGLQPERNVAALTEQYDITRWFRNFGARPKMLFENPLNDLKMQHAGLEYRATYNNGAGITFHNKLLNSPLQVTSRAQTTMSWVQS